MRGILMTLSAVTMFAVMMAFIKAADRVPAGQAVFFRAGIGVPILLAWLSLQGGLRDGLRTANPMGHFWRGIIGTIAMALGFAGLRLLPLPEVTALRFVTPILIVVFAALFLGERLRLIRISAVGVGLIGVLVIVWPRLGLDGTSAELLGAVIVLTSATCAATAQILVKSMAQTERTTAIVLYFSLTASTLSLLTIPFGWVWPTPLEWTLLVGAGLVGAAGQILLTASYRYADASVLAPFSYVSMLWAIVIGYFVFAEVPTVQMLAGATLIIASGVAIVLRERQLGKQATAERKLGAKGM